MHKCRIFVLIYFFILIGFSHPHNSYAKSSKHVFENGLTTIISEMPSNPMVSVYALIKTGSATERNFLGSGISHFLEHMLFKGTRSYAVGKIASHIQAIGGTINASTGKDYTIYTITVPSKHLNHHEKG